ncbi:endonuclease/exonuclease/phosphatase family protein [Sphingomonas jaspsi]|uniref:endonuclease/exonuclease/phosphatase family protein n=1 Tax=Sphingomonas jaspsi TaxID=392409 RepID=UPI0004B409C4|nr:endonuclease/exonuclease/phosphatase family protein [Sphingomonas jaspsi]
MIDRLRIHGVGYWLKRVGRFLFIALSSLLIFLTFLPEWQTDRWWVRQWDYPRLQVAALLLILVVSIWWIGLKRGRAFVALVVGLGAALAWQVSHFLAYLPPYLRQVATAENCPAERQISLMNANVLLTNKEYGKLLGLVGRWNPDVLLLLETGQGWEKAVAPLASRYPNQLSEAAPNTYGMILMTRLPMSGRIEHLLQPGIPSANVRLTLGGGQQVILHALHPEPPWPGDDSGERDAELVMVGREVRDDGRASIVMGDLNDVAWSRTSRLFKDVGGMRDPRVGRGFYPTFHAGHPLFRWPLDHLFVTPHFEVMEMHVLEDIGSDHFPIFFRLCLTDRAGERKVGTSALAETEQEASQELGEGVAEKKEEQRGR